MPRIRIAQLWQATPSWSQSAKTTATEPSTCEYCDKKGCDGCPVPFNDEPFLKDIKIKGKAEIELFWVKNAKEILDTMEGKTNQSKKGSGSKGGIKIADCFELFSEP